MVDSKRTSAQFIGLLSGWGKQFRPALAFMAALILSPVAIATAVVPAVAGGNISLNDPSRISRMSVTVNKSETIRFGRGFAEALVANPEFADVTPLTDQTLYIIGKKVGQTRVTVLDRDKHLLGVVDVEINYDISGLRKELQRDRLLDGVRVTAANGRIMLSGTVPDATAQNRALAIASQFTGLAEGAEAKSSTQSDVKSPNKEATGDAKATVTPVKDAVINSMTVRASQQVMLEVRFVEVNRTAARDLGVNWGTANKSIVAATGAASGLFPLAGIPSGATQFGQAVVSLLNNGSAEVILQALEKRGLARRLAEPNLVTLSGDTANFLAGGEFPYPVAQTGGIGAGTITIEFKKFGIALAFTPTVLGEGQINLKIEPEVSDIDPTHTFSFGGGITVPSLIVRRAKATVELRDGQSFAIAGLLDSKHTTDQTQLPWIGQVPVLGALFRSASYQKSETELVIIVTPRLVQPAVPGQRFETPLDQKVAGNDVDLFLLGRNERDKHFDAPYGHIIDIESSHWAATTDRTPREESGRKNVLK